jgi:hypothetical protein
MFAFLAPPAPPPTALVDDPPPAEVESAPATSSSPPLPRPRGRDSWLLALEGVLRAPSDVGVQAGVEFPFRLRVFTGFGYMPVGWLTGFVADVTPNRAARAVLTLPSYSGTIWRLQVGVRPFRKLGFYADAGYAHASIRGTYTPSDAVADEFDIGGAFAVDSSLNLWLVEIGHEWVVARRGVLALGLGVMSTFDANTNIAYTGAGPRPAELARGEHLADDALESYGTIPFVTVRVGVDLL